MEDLDRLRIKAGLSIYAVAKAAGVKYPTAHNIFTGKCLNPRLATYEALLGVLKKARKAKAKTRGTR